MLEDSGGSKAECEDKPEPTIKYCLFAARGHDSESGVKDKYRIEYKPVCYVTINKMFRSVQRMFPLILII